MVTKEWFSLGGNTPPLGLRRPYSGLAGYAGSPDILLYSYITLKPRPDGRKEGREVLYPSGAHFKRQLHTFRWFWLVLAGSGLLLAASGRNRMVVKNAERCYTLLEPISSDSYTLFAGFGWFWLVLACFWLLLAETGWS